MANDRDFFRAGTPEAAALFKAAVGNIELEILGFCNRRCSFCPNHVLDRKSRPDKMDDKLFSSIMRQLASIDYSRVLHFHRYNEPLADRPYALQRVRECRAYLPHVNLQIFTNGDYLNADYIRELSDAGCNSLVINCYTRDDASYDVRLTRETMIKRLEKFDFPYSFEKASDHSYKASVSFDKPMKITMHAANFWRPIDEQGTPWAQDRGHIVHNASRYQRIAPCLIPFTEMQIEWDGTLMPCCNLRSDAPEHQPFIVGRLTPETDLFQAWVDARYVSWRRSLIGVGPKSAPCDTCRYAEQPLTPAYLQAIHTMEQAAMMV